MATPDDIEAALTFEITGSMVTPERFQRTLTAFFDLLAEVTRAIMPEAERACWRIQVKQGSNLVGVLPAPAMPASDAVSIQQALVSGLLSLQDVPAEPPAFSEKALAHVKRLTTGISVRDDDDTTIKVWGQRAPVPITSRLASNVAELLGEAYTDYGSVEGRLKTVSEAGSFRIVLYEPVFNRAVRCDIPEHLLGLALGLFGRRVEVYGNVSYRQNGLVNRVAVEEIVAFPLENELPDHEKVRGILQANA